MVRRNLISSNILGELESEGKRKREKEDKMDRESNGWKKVKPTIFQSV
jgi:hypothetical protein